MTHLEWEGIFHFLINLTERGFTEVPYIIKHESNLVIDGIEDVLVWPEGSGVSALVRSIVNDPEGASVFSSEDGINFKKTNNVKNYPVSASAYRPEAFTDSGKGEQIKWGFHVVQEAPTARASILRFDIEK